MCGIVGYVGHRDCADVLVSALTRLEYRGYDSAGIAVFEDGAISVAKSKGKLKDLINKMTDISPIPTKNLPQKKKLRKY